MPWRATAQNRDNDDRDLLATLDGRAIGIATLLGRPPDWVRATIAERLVAVVAYICEGLGRAGEAQGLAPRGAGGPDLAALIEAIERDHAALVPALWHVIDKPGVIEGWFVALRTG